MTFDTITQPYYYLEVVNLKINATDYQAKDVIRIIREWTELNQKEFGVLLKRSRDSINNIENGRNRMYFNDFLDMCKNFNIKVTIEKK